MQEGIYPIINNGTYNTYIVSSAKKIVFKLPNPVLNQLTILICSALKSLKIGNVNITIAPDDLFASIDDLIKELNERFDGDFNTESTSGIIIGLIRMLGEDEEVRRRAKQNSPEDFKLFLKDKIEDVLFKGRNSADKFFRKMLDNDDAESALLAFLNNIIYNEARKKIEEYVKEVNKSNEKN